MYYEFRSEGVSKDSISRDIQGEYVEDGVSGATLTVTDSVLSIAMPILNGNGMHYFRSEELLLNLVREALEILDKQREEEDLLRGSQYHEECCRLLASKLPSMKPSAVLALRELIVDGALPIGQGVITKENLLAVIDSRLQPLGDAAD